MHIVLDSDIATFGTFLLVATPTVFHAFGTGHLATPLAIEWDILVAA